MPHNRSNNDSNSPNRHTRNTIDFSFNTFFTNINDFSSNNITFFPLDKSNNKIINKNPKSAPQSSKKSLNWRSLYSVDNSLNLTSQINMDNSLNTNLIPYKNDIDVTLNQFDMTVKKILDLLDEIDKINNVSNTVNDVSNNHRQLLNTLDNNNNSRFPSIKARPFTSNKERQNLSTLLDKYNLEYDKYNTINSPRDKYNPYSDILSSLDAPYPLIEHHKETQDKYKLPKSEEFELEKEFVTIDIEIKNIKDLIKLCDDYPMAANVEYNINMQAIHNVKEPLIELDNMVGMNSLKENIVDQVLYFIQNLHNTNAKSEDFMHTVIYGPPGTGKTEIAKIMGKIFSKIGVLKKESFKKVTRSDLIAGYLGQTAIKTRDAIKESLGGVMFIDEAYALGNQEKRDSFAKECIDTLCEALSDHKKDLMIIIAGYEKELKECFFNYNEGLESRFTWRFKIDDYTAEELKSIFEKKVKDSGWSLNDTIKISWFENNMDYFKYYGRDMETLFCKTKIAHSRRVFCKPKEDKTKITLKDLEKGLEVYLQNEEVKDRKNSKDFENIAHMYN